MASTVWKGQLTFGLVSFPIRLVRAARKERMPMRYVFEQTPEAPAPQEDETGEPDNGFSGAPAAAVSPVRQAYFVEGREEPVRPAELQRAYEVAPDQFAIVRPQELRRMRLPTSPDMQIVRAVRMEEIDPIFLETSYYVQPGSGGDHSYGLFYRALKEVASAALARVTMHGREHIVIIRAGQKGLIAHTMYYVTEVRASEEHATPAVEVAPKELDLAKRFLEAIAEPFRPEEFTDRYREQLESLVAAKEPAAKAATETAPPAKVANIIDALRKSLEQIQSGKTARKPPVAIDRAPRSVKRKR